MRYQEENRRANLFDSSTKIDVGDHLGAMMKPRNKLL